MWPALLACVEPAPREREPGPVDPTDPSVVCADPAARDERRFDRVVIDGPGLDWHRFTGAGVVAADLDGDVDFDLFVPGPDTARLFRNDGAGTFTEDLAALPAREYASIIGGVAADLDADGDLDLVVTRWGLPDILLWNDGGVFVDAGDPVFSGPGWHSQSATVADLDLDGALDVIVAGHGLIDDSGDRVVIPGPGDPSRLLRGDGAGGFTDISDRLPQRFQDAYTYVVGVSDLDRDGTPDLFAQNDYSSWRPTMGAWNRGSRFDVVEGETGLVLRRAGMGLAAEDIDEDGLDDFLIPVWDEVILLRSSAGPWVDASDAMGVALRPHDEPWVAWGADWVDLDLDGDLDGLVASGHLDVGPPQAASGMSTANAELQTYTVLEREGEGFVEATEAWGLDDVGVWRGFAVADLNADGWPDLVRRDQDGPIVIDLSRCGSSAWLTVVPEPPHLAVGARVTVTAGDRSFTRTVRAGGTSLASSGPPEVTFGLGDLEQVDAVEVLWPDGSIDALGATGARRRVAIAR